MDLGLQGKTALVTGAGSGIGKAVALALAHEGVAVALGDLNAQTVAVAAAEARKAGVPALDLAFDVADEGACLRALQTTRDRLGAVDILVNNAGICPFRKLDEIPAAEWDRVLAVNLRSAFVLSQAVMPWMQERRWGRIINMSSMAGKVGGLAVAAHYSASKAGLICLAKTLARVGAPFGVTANAVAPAFIRTPLYIGDELATQVERIPVGRVGEPEEVAAAVLFLVSNQAGFITGEVLDINGGMLMD